MIHYLRGWIQLSRKEEQVFLEDKNNVSCWQRALALNPKILLLDDFTARVDPQTEQRILSNVMNNYPDLTLISVTQKIAPVKDFEQIILLMEGEVVASGQHKTLKSSCPEYIQIFKLSTKHQPL